MMCRAHCPTPSARAPVCLYAAGLSPVLHCAIPAPDTSLVKLYYLDVYSRHHCHCTYCTAGLHNLTSMQVELQPGLYHIK